MEQEPQQPLPSEPQARPSDETSPQPAPAEGQGAPVSDAPAAGRAGPSPTQQQGYPFYPPYAPPPYPPPGQYPPPGAYPPQAAVGQYPPGPYPAWGSYPAYGWPPQPPAGPPAPPPQAPKRSMPLGLIVLLVGLAVVVIAAGIGGTLALTRAGHTVATRTAAPTAPATVTATAMPPNWFDFKDPLNGTVGHEWPVSDTCYFRNGAYHVDPGTAYVWYLCYATRAGKFSDFDVHVTVEEESGPLNYGVGLVFRYVSTGNFYTFTIDGNGDAWVSKWTDKKPENISSTWNPSPFTQGLHVPHTLRVTAEGPLFSFYVDGTEVGSVRDTTYTDGDVGLFSGGSQLDAAFTNFEVAGAE